MEAIEQRVVALEKEVVELKKQLESTMAISTPFHADAKQPPVSLQIRDRLRAKT